MKALEVRLTLGPGNERVVGRLAENRRRVFFEYAPEFLRDPLWLSPFKLPPQPGLIEHRDRDFGPLFGLFDDSLPDGWGLLLMDRFFRQRGTALGEVSPLDRLAYLGTRTMGALTYHPPSDPEARDPELLDLHRAATASREVLAGSTEEVLPQLLRAGGSPGGARPKVLIGVRGDTIYSGEDDLPPDTEHWMVKFSGRDDLADAGPIELAYAEMAREAGIAMPRTRLFETAEGDRFFGVERFDRHLDETGQSGRSHVHTFGNLIHADFRIPSCDYRQLLEVTQVLTRNHQDVLECIRRMVFNVATHNRDDHVKNFAFRMTSGGEWQLSPAYDLVYAAGPGGEHSMTVAGEGQAPSRRHLLELVDSVGVTRPVAEEIIEQVAAAARSWSAHAKRSGVGRKSQQEIAAAIETCLARL
ncbi:MAG: type II toxin-antitoxin system HipA family toxin [Acidobacteriota bacterium]